MAGYFGLVMPDGTLEESMEKTLALKEHDCDDVLVSARSDLFHCSEKSRRKLAFYAALLHSRATQRRDWTRTNWLEIHKQLDETLQDDQYVQALANHFTVRHKKRFSRTRVRNDIKTLIKNHTSTEGVRNYFVEQVLEYAEMITNLLLAKQFRVWKAPQGSQFVTSDNPLVSFVVMSNGRFAPGFGFNHKDTVGALPIAPDACLLFGGNDPSERFYVDTKAVDEINWAVIGLADKYVYASTEDDAIQKLSQEIIGTYRYGVTSFIPRGPLPHIREMMPQLLNFQTKRSERKPRRSKSTTSRKRKSNS